MFLALHGQDLHYRNVQYAASHVRSSVFLFRLENILMLAGGPGADYGRRSACKAADSTLWRRRDGTIVDRGGWE